MALISCPECGKEVSDKAKTCPHCGYSLTEVEPMEVVPKVRVTELSEPKSNFILGFILVSAGIAMMFGWAFFGLIFGVLPFFCGVIAFVPKQTGPCPYCGHDITIRASAVTEKCPHCHETFSKHENTLQTLE